MGSIGTRCDNCHTPLPTEITEGDETYTDWGWSELDTTPVDYLKLLAAITSDNPHLSRVARQYEMGLMEHVTPSQRFGIPHGVPSGVRVGVKNGWYKETATGWQINSAGYVFSTNERYRAVIMTSHNPSESYGIDTVNGAGRLLFNLIHAAHKAS